MWASGSLQKKRTVHNTVRKIDYSIVKQAENFQYTIGFVDLADYTAGNAGCQAICRYISCHDTAGANYAILFYRNSGTYCNICPKPAIIPNFYRFCIAHTFYTPIRRLYPFTFIRKQGMQRRHNRYIRSKITVVSNRNICVILNRKIKIGKQPFTDFRVPPIMDIDWSLQKAVFAQFCKNIIKNLVPQVRFILKGLVVL